MTYFIHRNLSGTIASVHVEHMPGYNDETLADNHPDIVAFFLAAKPSGVTYEAFQNRFTTDEFNAATDFVYESDLVTGKPKRRALIQGLSRAMAKNSVGLLEARTIAFMDALVAGGVITAARKTEILTP